MITANGKKVTMYKRMAATDPATALRKEAARINL